MTAIDGEFCLIMIAVKYCISNRSIWCCIQTRDMFSASR